MILSTFVKAKLALEEFKNDERGVTAIEYAVIGAAIAAVLTAVVVGDTGIAGELKDSFEALKTSLTGSQATLS